MATQSIKLRFLCSTPEPLDFKVQVPRSLITKSRASHPNDPELKQSFTSTIMPLVLAHKDAAFSACQRECVTCNGLATHPILNPMSWLHTEDPMVAVMVCPVCPKASCDTNARQQIQEMMFKMGMGGAPVESESGDRTQGEIRACVVCAKVADTFKCSRCKVAFYCGKEHQKADWKFHKKGCKTAT